MQIDVDMSATTSETGGGDPGGDGAGFSYAGYNKVIKQETKVEFFTLCKKRQGQVDHSFHILILPYSIYLHMAFLQLLIELVINIIVYTLLYNHEGYQILNYRS